MKKTYVMVVDGKPKKAFRVEDDATAAQRVDMWAKIAKAYEGATGDEVCTARLATISEQAAWRAASVEDSLNNTGPEDDDCGPDDVVAQL